MPQKKLAKAVCAWLVEYEHFSPEEASKLQKDFTENDKSEFVDFVLSEGLVQESHLLDALSDYYQVPALDVIGYLFDHDLVRKFPKGVLHRNAFIPITVDQNIMTVVASEPDNEELLSIIGEYVSYDVRFNVGLRRDITSSISEFYDESVTDVPED